MEFTTVLFYLFALVLVLSGFRVVTAPDPVQSALFLVLAFFNAAAVWMLLHAEFLAIVLVLVYVGAVMVLFLFVVMMLDFDHLGLRADFKRFLPWALIVGGIVVIEIALILWRGYGDTTTPIAEQAPNISNTTLLGRLIYTEYLFPFLIAGLLLLVAIIAAVALTLRHRTGVKRADVSRQIGTRREDRVRIVKMPSELGSPDASTEPPTPGQSGAGQVGK